MPGAISPTSCSDCHVPDGSGEAMQTLGFEAMCKDCHGRNIADRDFPGIPFFTIADQAGNQSISEASFTEFPAFMRMLFASDRRLENVDSPDGEVARVYGVREFLDDVSRNGQRAIDDQLGERFAAFGSFEPSIVPSLIEAKHVWMSSADQDSDQIQASNANSVKYQSPPVSEFGGGWYLEHDDQSVRYRPIGHADPLVKNWLELLIRRSNQNTPLSADDPILELTTLLANPTASGNEPLIGPVSSGRCLSCHVVARDQSGQLAIDWGSNGSSTKLGLTKFAHAPHLITSNETSCLNCHVLDSQDTLMLGQQKQDFASIWNDCEQVQLGCSSGLKAISKATCITCHNTASRSQQCGKCHNYHVRDLRRLLNANVFRAAK
ncbi:hypothetical protein AB1L42_01615 [Thalassoglobus sp. JC818]|uniref:hypothetical protein n=1 Tax=Thalassoglobus sp. JC818 TaxID=3232136 RepID=UPI00345766D8